MIAKAAQQDNLGDRGNRPPQVFGMHKEHATIPKKLDEIANKSKKIMSGATSIGPYAKAPAVDSGVNQSPTLRKNLKKPMQDSSLKDAQLLGVSKHVLDS